MELSESKRETHRCLSLSCTNAPSTTGVVICCEDVATSRATRLTVKLASPPHPIITLDGRTGILETATPPSVACVLSPIEARVVWKLMANPRQPFNARELVEHIWRYDTWADTAVVYTTISRIKQRLAAERFPNLLVTRRGFGYHVAGTLVSTA